MPQPKKCSRDDCPPSNVNRASTVKCKSCENEFHLPCFGIQKPSSELFVIKNIVFICDECLISTSSPKRKNSSNRNVKQSTINLDGSISTPTTPVFEIGRKSSINNSHNDQLLRKTVSSLATKIDDQIATISALKQSVDSMHATVKTNKAVSSTFTSFSNRTYAEALGSTNSKQEKTYSAAKLTDSETQRKVKGRQLISGTCNTTTHNLGTPVVMKRRGDNYSSTQRSNLTKSIYVSRLQTNVSPEAISGYIKQQLPDINENDFMLRMLVKKDQQLDQLSFISFRLQCTDSVYESLMTPSFWPQHVLIGEFYERPRKSLKVADFMTPIAVQNNSQSDTPKNEQRSQDMEMGSSLDHSTHLEN